MHQYDDYDDDESSEHSSVRKRKFVTTGASVDSIISDDVCLKPRKTERVFGDSSQVETIR